MEQWKDIKGYEGLYKVSNYGRVLSIGRVVHKKMYGGGIHAYRRKSRIKKTDVSKDGYHTVELSKDNTKKRFKVHRLVAISFVRNPLNRPIVNHIDSNPSNNKSTNLEWVNTSENALHSVKQGRWAGSKNIPHKNGSNINTSKLSIEQVKEIKKSTLSNAELGRMYGCTRTAIRFIKIGKNWKHV